MDVREGKRQNSFARNRRADDQITTKDNKCRHITNNVAGGKVLTREQSALRAADW